MLNDEGSVKGKGAGAMLPGRGSPFSPSEAPPSTSAPVPSLDAPEGGPQDLGPQDLAALLGLTGAAEAAPAWANFENDLPDWARNAEASAGPPKAEAAPPESGVSFGLVAGAPEGDEAPEWMNVHGGAETLAADGPADDAGLVAFSLPPSASMGVSGPEAMAAMNPAPPVDVANLPGVRLKLGMEATPGAREAAEAVEQPMAFGGGLQIDLEAVGPRADEAYRRKEDLAASKGQLKLLVSDAALQQMWAEIDDLENTIAPARRLSQALAEEMFERLAQARNYLLNDRSKIEEAKREIASVKYRLARVQRATWFEEPRYIFFGILLMLAATVAGFMLTNAVTMRSASLISPLAVGVESEVALNILFIILWSAILWGSIGGVTASLYNLWKHVAQEKDYHPEFAMWYYTNPLMGMILGAFMFVIVQAGVLAFLQNTPWVIYILAWAVGFQQHIAFRAINQVLKRIVPSEDSGEKKAPAPEKRPAPDASAKT